MEPIGNVIARVKKAIEGRKRDPNAFALVAVGDLVRLCEASPASEKRDELLRIWSKRKDKPQHRVSANVLDIAWIIEQAEGKPAPVPAKV